MCQPRAEIQRTRSACVTDRSTCGGGGGGGGFALNIGCEGGHRRELFGPKGGAQQTQRPGRWQEGDV